MKNIQAHTYGQGETGQQPLIRCHVFPRTIEVMILIKQELADLLSASSKTSDYRSFVFCS
jgi:hypothetical protein